MTLSPMLRGGSHVHRSRSVRSRAMPLAALALRPAALLQAAISSGRRAGILRMLLVIMHPGRRTRSTALEVALIATYNAPTHP